MKFRIKKGCFGYNPQVWYFVEERVLFFWVYKEYFADLEAAERYIAFRKRKEPKKKPKPPEIIGYY